MKDKTKAPMLLEFACSQRWQEMTGDERARHCAQCNQQVINISDYSQAQINELQERIDCGEKICVAFKAVKPEPVDVLGEWLPFVFPESSLGISGLLACSLTLGSCSLLALSASPARAQNGQKQESPRKGPLVPSSSNRVAGKGAGGTQSPLQVPVESLKKQLSGTGTACDVRIGQSDFGFLSGRPAPSAIRDTVNELIYEKDDFFNILPMALRFSIRQQLEKEGSINIPRVEWMAAVEELQGKSEQALNSYRLLLVLAEKQSAPPERKAELRKKIEAIAPKVYLSYLKDVDKNSKDETRLLGLLSKAQEVRTLSTSITKLCPWSEFASSIDHVAGNYDSERLASFALKVSSGEPKVPTLKKWRKKFIDALVRHFNERLERAQLELANGKLNDASELGYSLYLPTDAEAAALCDVGELFRVRLKLTPLLGDELRLRYLMDCIKCLSSSAYHPRDNKYRNQLSQLVLVEIKKRMALARDAMKKGERLQVIWRLWEAQGLIKALPEAIPGQLLREVKEFRQELKLNPDEELSF